MGSVFVGHDWAEDHHDVFIEDRDGRPLDGGRLVEGVEGVARFHAMVASLVEDPAEIVDQHPDAKVIRSLAGLGTILGARVLAEFGDDPNRDADAKCRKNYAGTSPITRASGKSHVVLARYARNRRLADACDVWAFAAITAPRRPRLLRPTPSRRRHPQPRPTSPRQPPRRHPPRLPPPPNPLRRTHGLGRRVDIAA